MEFAARIRTNLNEEQVNLRVANVIERLGLNSCSNNQVGSLLKRGISGGERKRTSIGYELITEPALLLLDEPTSGLDSSTSKRIIQLLRKEAERGMSVLATIHQPSSDLLMMFDRVILLSEGYTVYTGPPQLVAKYFNQFGF